MKSGRPPRAQRQPGALSAAGKYTLRSDPYRRDTFRSQSNSSDAPWTLWVVLIGAIMPVFAIVRRFPHAARWAARSLAEVQSDHLAVARSAFDLSREEQFRRIG